METQLTGESDGAVPQRGLGWLGIGLGLAEVAVPGAIAYAVGAGRPSRGRVGLAAAAVLGVTLLDRLARRRLQRAQVASQSATVTIDRPLSEVEAYFERLGEVVRRDVTLRPARNGRATELEVQGKPVGELRRIKKLLEREKGRAA